MEKNGSVVASPRNPGSLPSRTPGEAKSDWQRSTLHLRGSRTPHSAFTLPAHLPHTRLLTCLIDLCAPTLTGINRNTSVDLMIFGSVFTCMQRPLPWDPQCSHQGKGFVGLTHRHISVQRACRSCAHSESVSACTVTLFTDAALYSETNTALYSLLLRDPFAHGFRWVLMGKIDDKLCRKALQLDISQERWLDRGVDKLIMKWSITIKCASGDLGMKVCRSQQRE